MQRGLNILFSLNAIMAALTELELEYILRYIFLVAYIHRPRSITELAMIAGVTKKTACRAVDRLKELKLMVVVRNNRRLAPVAILPHACQEVLVARFRTEYDLSPAKGEFITRQYALLRIWNRNWIFNARPEFLENPETKEPMEYDLYCPDEAVAIEFMGTQHDFLTEMYPSAEQFARIQARDKAKLEISERMGVRLIRLTPETLLPETFDELLPKDLQLYYVDREGPLYIAIRDACLRYTRRARRANQNQRSTGQRP